TNTGLSDTIIVDGNLNLGGTLNVTNLAGFGPGTYTLITCGGSLNGSLTIGSTPPGYSYTVDTGTPGQVNLVVVPLPAFQSIKLDNGDVVISGTGPTNQTFHLLESTDLTLPLNSWTSVATNTFDATGNFSITNLIDSGGPKIFYQLLLP
ncbi:MAG TPA: hypothetical protein VKA67_07125, partial [Verrucomicrobiae bacterium]|nr:hypothetical protein [Verrucomicrobiae bacterium]